MLKAAQTTYDKIFDLITRYATCVLSRFRTRSLPGFGPQNPNEAN